MGEKVVFSTNVAGTTEYPHLKELSWGTSLVVQQLDSVFPTQWAQFPSKEGGTGSHMLQQRFRVLQLRFGAVK